MTIVKNSEFCLSSKLLEIVADKKGGEKMTVDELFKKFDHSGFGLILILFSFPMAIPLPYPPGFTTILGLPLFFIAWQMMMGRKELWLPNFIGKKEISVQNIRTAINAASKFFKFFEKKLSERMLFFSSFIGEKIIGFISLICSISIILPIILGNSVPSAGIMIMAIGYLYRDGLVVIMGIIVSFIGLFIASLVVLFGLKFLLYFVPESLIHFFSNTE